MNQRSYRTSSNGKNNLKYRKKLYGQRHLSQSFTKEKKGNKLTTQQQKNDKIQNGAF